MSTNRQRPGRQREEAERLSDGRSGREDNSQDRQREMMKMEKRGWRERDREKKRKHATVKCISGNMHPVRWNWTRWKNIVPGQAQSESLG